MRHRRGAAAFRGAQLDRYHRFAGRTRGLAGVAERLGVADALEVDHDDADRRIGDEIIHQVGRFQTGLVAGRDHVTDADAAILQRLADRHYDRAGLAGDRDRARFHGHHAIVDIGEELFAGA